MYVCYHSTMPIRAMLMKLISPHCDKWCFVVILCLLLSLCCAGVDEHHQIDSNVLMEVCQKLQVTVDEVMAALRSGNHNSHLTIAYELVRDNR